MLKNWKDFLVKYQLPVILFILLVVTLIVYLPGMNQLGYYRDDWNIIFNTVTQGSEKMMEYYQADRPALGYLMRQADRWFGPDPYPYLLVNLLCRYLCAVFFLLTLRLIWKNHPTPMFTAAAFALVFPGFLRQVDSLTYLPHFTAMLAITISIWLSICALTVRHAAAKAAMIVPAMALAMVSMFFMEYFIGLEAFRLVLFFGWYWQANQKWGQRVGRTIAAMLPYIAGAGLFFVWRSFMFDATRAGTDVSAIASSMIKSPRRYALDFVYKEITNTLKVIFGSWVIPPQNEVAQVGYKPFWRLFLWGLIPAAIFAVCFVLLMNFQSRVKPVADENSKSSKAMWQKQWVLLGLAGVALSMAPLILTQREVTFSSSLDRFTFHAIYPAVMCLIGLIALLRGRWLKPVIVSILFFVAVMTQRVNVQNHIRQTRETNDFWWQVSWRIPQIVPETLVFPVGKFFVEEDYELFSPFHLIYYPDEDHIQVGCDLVNGGSVRLTEMGAFRDRMIRLIFLYKDYSQPLAITKPTEKSCVQVIDGRNPIYSSHEWSKIADIGKYSQISKIMTDAEPHTPPAQLFGAEPAHGWCYYYEKMALAQQVEDWESVASYADEALALKLHSKDPVEWIPLVQTFAYLGREDQARGYAAIINSDEYLKFQACRYFRTAPEYLKVHPSANAQKWLEGEFCGD